MTQQGGSRDRPGESSAPMPGLDALLLASLADGPEAVLIRDDEQSLTGRAFAARVQSMAGQMKLCGLQPGDRILLTMGANAACLTALFAALRAGLVPALVPCGLGPMDIAASANAAGAVALGGPSRYGALMQGEALLSAAAICDTIRFVATFGPEAIDGAADFSSRSLEALPAPNAMFGPEAPAIVTFEGRSGLQAPVMHRQATLSAAALALVERARIDPSRPLVSTIAPATLAGLVAGPFAALIGASRLVLHGPFDGRGFLLAHDGEPDAHFVIPLTLAPLFAEAGLAQAGGSLVLLSRFSGRAAFALPPGLVEARSVVDLYAFGEDALVPRSRAGGAAQPPNSEPEERTAPVLGADRAITSAASGRSRGAAG